MKIFRNQSSRLSKDVLGLGKAFFQYTFPLIPMQSTTSLKFLSFLLGISLLGGIAKGVTLSSVVPIESECRISPFVAGDGGLSDNFMNLIPNSSVGFTVSWTEFNPTLAAAYVEMISLNDPRDFIVPVDLLSISLGNSQGRNDSLLSAIKILQGLADSGENEIIVVNDRYRNDKPSRSVSSDGDQGTALAGINNDPSPNAALAYGLVATAVNVPEPSAVFLVGLSFIGFLHRRRDS